jgi:integrase
MIRPIRTLPVDWHVWPEQPAASLACLISVTTALRIAEVISLNAEDFAQGNGDGLHVRVQVKGRDKRTRQKRERLVYFPPVLVQEIRTYLDGRTSGPLLLSPQYPGVRLSARTLEHWWLAAQRKAGVSPTYPFHSLRHTAITRFARACQDPYKVAMYAGHSSLNMTMRYFHGTQEDVDRVQDSISIKKIKGL